MTSQGISLAVLGKECICRAQLGEASVANLPGNSIQKERLFKCAEKELSLAVVHSPIRI